MGKLQDLYIKKMVDYLWNQGKLYAENAWWQAETKIQTGNQRDAFGWGVYFNKQLMKWGAPMDMIAQEPHRDKWGGESYGREWIFDFLANEFIPETDGFCLVVANAAPYSVSHEMGNTPTGRKYRILSKQVGKMRQLANRFKGAEIYTFNLGGGGAGRRGRPKGSKNRKNR